MKLAYRLLSAPLLVAVVALTAAGINSMLMLHSLSASRAGFAADAEDYQTALKVQEKLGLAHGNVYRTLALLESMDDAATKAYLKDFGARVEGVKELVAKIVAGQETDAALKAAVAATAPLFDKYAKNVHKAVELSAVDANMGVAAMHAARASFTEAGEALSAIVVRINVRHEEQSAAADAATKRQALLLAALGLLAVGATLAWSWAGQRRIVAEVAKAVQLSEDVARGKLDTTISSQRADEIGDLVRAMAQMSLQLRDAMRTVQQATSSIAHASAEIASGNLDLSQRTEQTAASLQETAGSMSQLTETVRQSADSAKQADQLAASAAEVAQRGGKVVAEVVATMHEINSSSKKIADIIGTIDGIAFQTNILALNAAVEAARAGEQGRGFAVVASEVRSLAGRSAQAAREIKALIGSSVEKVESGTRLVGDAGTTMTEIVASVQRVSNIIGEISAAAGGQSTGIAKVDQAVNELDRMTQQNAALVEESAAAAESLKAQAVTLGEVVGRFELGDAAAPTAATTPPVPTPTSVPAQRSSPNPGLQSVARGVVAKAQAKSKITPRTSGASTSTAAAKPATATTPATADGEGDWTSF